MPRHDHRPRQTATAAAVAVAALGISACGPATPPTGGPVEQLLEAHAAPAGPYTGPYDQAFAEDLAHYVEEEVALSAKVETVVNPISFTITHPADTGEDSAEVGAVPPLLVVVFDDTFPALRPGDPVEITGTLHEAYNVPDTKENLGQPPGPEVLASYDGQPFINATSVQHPAPQVTAPSS